MSKLEEIKQQRLPEIKAALAKYGINGTTEVVYNPTYDELFNEETQTSLEGYEKGKVTERQIHRNGRELQRHRLVDNRGI